MRDRYGKIDVYHCENQLVYRFLSSVIVSIRYEYPVSQVYIICQTFIQSMLLFVTVNKHCV